MVALITQRSGICKAQPFRSERPIPSVKRRPAENRQPSPSSLILPGVNLEAFSRAVRERVGSFPGFSKPRTLSSTSLQRQGTAGRSCSSGNDVPKGMQQYFDAATGQPGIEDILLTMRSDVEAYYGRLGKAREFSRAPQD